MVLSCRAAATLSELEAAGSLQLELLAAFRCVEGAFRSDRAVAKACSEIESKGHHLHRM